ncbi:hypothetical protein EZS27_012675 [termite gut metagenome]|uniref:Uncharacterized protein n=1 Tax=termite gut metagenome TaxID=433724 RepID=A0A5J4RZR2_9ZZZZ
MYGKPLGVLWESYGICMGIGQLNSSGRCFFRFYPFRVNTKIRIFFFFATCTTGFIVYICIRKQSVGLSLAFVCKEESPGNTEHPTS